MNIVRKLIALLLLAGFCAPIYASVQSIDLPSCAVYNDADEDKGETKEGDEEPDCE